MQNYITIHSETYNIRMQLIKSDVFLYLARSSAIEVGHRATRLSVEILQLRIIPFEKKIAIDK